MVFGGLISNVGKAKTCDNLLTLTEIETENIVIGSSISVNGVCLTVIKTTENSVEFELSEETLNLTNLSTLNNDIVNVEFPITYSSYLDGHVLSGHVDETGTVESIIDKKVGIDIWIKCHSYDRLIYKDSIGINGVSLTIAEIKNDMFRLAIIPHTYENTNIKSLITGSVVNIEFNRLKQEYKIKDDEYFMNIAIDLSKKGRCTTSPNPWVGCVIVHNNAIVGEGYHEKCGQPHAEVIAFSEVPENIENTTVYVTLEPCSHTGKTPPCVDLLIKKKVKKVVIGLTDPDSNVNGLGISKLKNAGINIVTGVCQDKISKSLRSYLYHRQTGLPYVTLKIAMSLDGSIQDYQGKSQWITGEESRKHCHNLRSKQDGILVGTNTILMDNPSLNNRYSELPSPTRIVLDREGKLRKLQLNIFDPTIAPTMVFTTLSPSEYEINNVEIIQVESFDLREIVKILGERGFLSLLVEGGPKLHSSFLQLGLSNELYIYRSGKVLGTGAYNWNREIPSIPLDISNVSDAKSVKLLGSDVLEKYILNKFPTFNYQLDTLELAIQKFKKGGMVIIVDDESRENEGDLVVSAEYITEDQMTFIVNNTSGIVCVPMTQDRADKLGLDRMVKNNQDKHQTAFTISCDSINTTTGVSSKDRVETVKSLVLGRKEELSCPGHIYPLIARDGLMKVRQGHTEASLQLCQLSDMDLIAVISELKNMDGTMKNREDSIEFAKLHGIPVISTSQLIPSSNHMIDYLSECDFTNEYGNWTLRCYPGSSRPQVVLIKNTNFKGYVPVRIHSECFTGDVLGSHLCDCGSQLDNSMKLMQQQNQGVIIYLTGHEGRGIGLVDKLKAYSLQQNEQMSTYEANVKLGHKEDYRTYESAIEILKSLDLTQIHLLTNNPSKIKSLSLVFDLQYDPIEGNITDKNIKYLNDKKQYFESQSGKYQKKILNYISDLPSKTKISSLKICIVSTTWHEDLIEQMTSQTQQHLVSLGIELVDTVKVPGCFEIPLACKTLTSKYDCIICIGILIKGDTHHFEQVADATTKGLMEVQLNQSTPIVNGILCCYNTDQAIDRINPNFGLAKSYALTAVRMTQFF